MEMENKKLKSVVTGASGFVGSHLVDLLIEKGHEVVCILRKSSSRRWLEGKPVQIVDAGLFDYDALKEVLKDADYLFHVAGVVKSKSDEGYTRGNVETTKSLLEVVAKNNRNIKKIVIVSSQTAGGPSLSEKARIESDLASPITRYGKSKLEQEKLAQSYMDILPITIVRPPAVYGERDTEIYLVFKTYKSGLMTLVGFDKKKLSLVYVKDLVNGIYLAAVSENSKGETYYIGPEEYYDWDIVSEAIKKAFGKSALKLRIPHSIVYVVAYIAQFFSMFSKNAATFNIEKARDFVQRYWTCDVSKAKEQLGYKQQYTLQEGMDRTIAWYKENKWL